MNPLDGSRTMAISGQQAGFSFAGLAFAANGDLVVAANMGSSDAAVVQVNLAADISTVLLSRPIASFVGIAIVPALSRPSSSCGGGVPCACGDLVVRDRTLRGTDPVTRTVCPGDGLVVADGVTLDLGGATLRGQGVGAGVRIEAGATKVTVKGGKLTGFATGVRGEGTATHLTRLPIFDNARDGVTLSGDGHRWRRP